MPNKHYLINLVFKNFVYLVHQRSLIIFNDQNRLTTFNVFNENFLLCSTRRSRVMRSEMVTTRQMPGRNPTVGFIELFEDSSWSSRWSNAHPDG